MSDEKIIPLHQDEPPLALSAAHESSALRLTYLDNSGSLQRATLSTTTRLTDLCCTSAELKSFKFKLAQALSLVGMTVTSVEFAGSVFIELL